MKHLLMPLLVLALTACSGRQTATLDNAAPETEVPFEVAQNYFFKNDQIIPETPKITTREEFDSLFGMATLMGADGQPTEIDFDRQFVLAIVLPETDVETEIRPLKLEARGDSLLYSYDITTGEQQSFTTRPLSIIVLDRKYENSQLLLTGNREITYFPAIDRYLVDSIGSFYSPGDHCVPLHSIVGVDERQADDIMVWGDFWVFNYDLVGDTLKCVSGGSHPGLMHIRQTATGFEVTAFDRVTDGASYLPSAKKIFGDKFDAFQAINSDAERREQLRADVLSEYVRRHNIAATMYQDYGWPARRLSR